MNETRLVERFMEMVRIDSPSKQESAMAAYCAAELDRLGFSVEWDNSQSATGSDTPQIIAHRKGSARSHVAFSCHMDCVPPCHGIEPYIDDENVIRPSGSTILSSDDKAGIAEVFEGIESAIEANGVCPSITVLLSVCEELSVAGAPYFPDVLFDPPVPCYVLDAEGSAGTVVLGAPYHWVFEARFAGRAAHAGVAPETGTSAIQMAAHAVSLMQLGRIDNTTTANVGVLEAAGATNIVPAEALMRGECRSLHEQAALQVKEALNTALEQGASQFGGTVDITWHLSYPGILHDESDEYVQLALKCARRLGLSTQCAVTGGGSDANVLEEKGAIAIPLGTGMTDFHSLEESVRVSDLRDCARFVEEIIKEMGARAGNAYTV